MKSSEKKAAILTLGCRVNQYESQTCAELFEKYGYRLSSVEEDCDVYLINTCSVTAESDRKCRQAIRKLCTRAAANRGCVVICGCHIQGHFEDYTSLPSVHLCGNTNKARFLESVLTGNAYETPCPPREEMLFYDTACLSSSTNTRAFIKIEDGCDNFCTYCIVPHLRGPVRSRPAEEVVEEAKRLADNGFREVVLTGIETSFYGRDLKNGIDLAELSRMVSEVKGIHRIRFGSLRPTLFTEEFTQRLSEVSKVLPHFHLSIQSGSNRVLAMMGRDYTKQDILKVFSTVRTYFPEATFSADLICGFPGEFESDVDDSAEIIEKGMLLHSHVFPYSERPGTPAAQMANPIPVRLRKERCARLVSLGEKISRENILDRKGKICRVLVEKIIGNRAFGYTEQFIHTVFSVSPAVKKGEIVTVRLSGDTERKPGQWFAKATMIPQSADLS